MSPLHSNRLLGVRARSRYPLNLGLCPSGGPVRSSGCQSQCPVCRRFWTKQALSDSPPFPALVIHQPPSFPPPQLWAWHQTAGWVRGGGPSCRAWLSWERGVPFPTAKEVEEGWAQSWWHCRIDHGTLSVKGQMVSNLGFMSCRVSVLKTHFCGHSTKAAIDSV